MKRVIFFAAVFVVVGQALVLAQPPRIAIPENNRATLRQPAPFPPAGDLDTKARKLFDAIVNDDPERALDFFFPRDPFLVLKGIANPAAYYDRLLGWYRRDIHMLHRELPDIANGTFLRFELSRRRTWQTVRSEANALPYWAVRHNWLHYRSGERDQKFEVKTVISWNDHWFITHLR